MRPQEIVTENVDEILQALRRRVRYPDTDLLADRQEEFGCRHPRIEDEGDLCIFWSLRQQRAHDGRLSRAHFPRELHETAGLVDAIQQVRQGLGVALAQIEIARIRSDRERLFVESEKRKVHESLLLDRIATPQGTAAKARAGLIQRRVEARCMRWRVFEKAEL